MDIKEIINYSQNKIEADDLTKQVRKQIKETAWEKQNQREGFSESFKPLISQFEKPVDPKKKNLFTQNQEILRNQLDLTEGINKNRLALKYALEQNQKALTEGLKENQKALTEGLKVQPQAITEGLENFGGKDYNNVSNPDPSSPSPSNPTSLLSDDDDDDKEEDVDDKEDNENQPSVKLFIDNVFDDQDLKVLKQYKYGEPADILKKDEEELEKLRIDVNKKIRSVNGKNKKETKTDKDIVFLNKYIQAKITWLSKYKQSLSDIIQSKKYEKKGEGIRNSLLFFPQELLKRFELLSGSLAAGNNGVLTEYIQIAHRLRDLGVVTNNQLNKLLRNYLNIR